MKKILTIAGSDSSGGAGIQADLKTFSALGTFGMSVITSITAQNTQGVYAVENLSPSIIEQQIQAILSDIAVDAIKIGMVSKSEIIKTIVKNLKGFSKYIIVDPVMISTSGHPLLDLEAKKHLTQELFPLAFLITPNIPEAESLINLKIETLEDMKKAATFLIKMGPKNILIKGGHLKGDANDLLFDGKNFHIFQSKRIHTENTHGTGCTLSSAISSYLAKEYSILDAIKKAKNFVHTAIENSFPIGKGPGPIHHFYDLYKKSEKI